MVHEVKINIADVIGDSEFVDTEDGNAIHQLIASALDEGKNVEVSFAGGEQIITAFTNAAIGQLYGEFDEELIRNKLKFTDIPEGFSGTIGKSINRAKRYFANRQEIDKIISDGDEE